MSVLSFARSASHPVFRDTGSHCANVELLEFPKKATECSFGASRSSKSFPDMPNEFRVSGCREESRLIIHEESEYSKAGWERGIAQNWLPFQDHRISGIVQGIHLVLNFVKLFRSLSFCTAHIFQFFFFLKTPHTIFLKNSFLFCPIRCITS